ncbi:MAG: metal-dependent hydrolase [Desulfovibrio sp.]|jgi:inner membrane protein|nr:metal-dependent hydrolase [Desulfovibrio sp.]
MDPLSHAASGAVAFLAMKERPAHRLALPLAALAAASPDVDIFFASTPLQSLLLHRGITHSLAALPVMGLLLACASRPLWRATTPGRWGFVKVWLFMSALAGLHIWLDVVTTYGTMIFLPFSHERVRLNGLFIVDPLLTLPLLCGLFYAVKKSSRAAALGALVWIFFWPALGVALNRLHTASVSARLADQGRQARQVTVLPDALAPLFWRVLFAEDREQGKNAPQTVFELPLDAFGREGGPAREYRGMPADLAEELAGASTVCKYFFDFSILPVMVPLRGQDTPEQGHAGQFTSGAPSEGFWLVHDLRFGSSLAFVNKLMALRPNADIPFLLMVELVKNKAAKSGLALARERLRFSDSGRDSGWQKPRPSRNPPFGAWLTGLR